MTSPSFSRLRGVGEVGLIAFFAYFPTLVMSAGTFNADTKLYLTTNASRLISSSRYAWDPSQFGGYVPHQAIGYLWPMGPFYWIFDVLGLPAWLAQRSFVATLFFLASLGVLRLLRCSGFSRSAALLAAIAYQFTPYVLAYQSRTSAMLLPWCGLPWMVLIALKGVRSPSWRYPALLALIVGSVGGINATSLIMVAPAPFIVLIDTLFREAPLRPLVYRFALRSGALCSAVSLWWIAMVAIQGRYGADVLSYSETLEAVSSTSVSSEVFRGLGYWLNYVVTTAYDSTSQSIAYLENIRTLRISYIVPVLGAIGLAFTQSRIRRLAALWLVVGMLLAVGVYPLENSSLLTRVLSSHPDSSAALALRSSTRAIPMVCLALVVGLASLFTVVMRALARCKLRSVRWTRLVVLPALVLCCVMSVPSRFHDGVGDPSLAHESLPKYWKDAGAQISERLGDDARALQLPGQEFGAYSWGFTVDPALAAATTTPILTRDLLPLGNPQAMDFVNAIDDASRQGRIDYAAARRIAAQLGVGVLVVPRDLDLERFGTYNPRQFETALGHDAVDIFGSGDSSISLRYFPASSLARLESTLTIVEGSGEGLVNIARGGIETGLVMYASDLSDDEILTAARDGANFIVTDSNRVQARQWRGSLDTIGMSEDDSDSSLRIEDIADRRLRLFDEDLAGSHTLVRQAGTIRATASSYGFPLSYWPESRPAYAIDGRHDTAWTVGAFSNPVGQTITLTSDTPFERLLLAQPDNSRWISKVSVRTDSDASWREVDLSEGSHLKGQSVQVSPTARVVTVRIDEVLPRSSFSYGKHGGPDIAIEGVGFTEMTSSNLIQTEVTSTPSRVTRLLRDTAQSPTTYVFSRLQSPRTSWWRSDPERSFSRKFDGLQGRYRVVVSGGVDLAHEAELSRRIGVTTFSSGAQSDGLFHAGWMATDGDASTSWRVKYGQSIQPNISFKVSSPTDVLRLTQCAAEDCNTATRVLVSDGLGHQVTADVKADEVDVRGLGAGLWTLKVLESSDRQIIDPRFGVRIRFPVEIFEIAGAGVTATRPSLEKLSRQNVSGLLRLNGRDVVFSSQSVEVQADGSFRTEALVNIIDGENEISSSSSILTVDDVVMKQIGGVTKTTPKGAQYTSLTIEGSPTNRQIIVPPHDQDTWLVFAEGFSPGWSATYEGKRLASHRQVEGGFNAWLLPASSQASRITLTFAPQRLANLAQAVSLIVALVCVLVVFRSRRRAVQLTTDEVSLVPRRTIDLRTRLVTIATVSALGLLGVPTTSFVSLAIAVAAVSVVQNCRQLSAVSISFIIYSVYGVIRRVQIDRPRPRFDWPSTVASFHSALLVGVIVLAVAAVLTGRDEAFH